MVDFLHAVHRCDGPLRLHGLDAEDLASVRIEHQGRFWRLDECADLYAQEVLAGILREDMVDRGVDVHHTQVGPWRTTGGVELESGYHLIEVEWGTYEDCTTKCSTIFEAMLEAWITAAKAFGWGGEIDDLSG